MKIADAPYFTILKARLDFLGARQKLIAENIANATTPGFTPRDLDEGAFRRALDSATQGRGASFSAKPVSRPDGETTIDGNSVVLEDQTLRAMETRMHFETAIALYQKGLQLVRMAAKSPQR